MGLLEARRQEDPSHLRPEAEAKSWRADALGALSRGGLRAAKKTTLGEAWTAWYQGCEAGSISNRSGDPYKRSALALLRVGDATPGATGFRAFASPILNALISKSSPTTCSPRLEPVNDPGTLLPVRAIFRRALSRGESRDPCSGLQLPAVRGRASATRPRQKPSADRRCPCRRPPDLGDRHVWRACGVASCRR